MKNLKILKFDQKLIGVGIVDGYRLKFDSHSNEIHQVVDWLSNTLGEGIMTNYGHLEGPSWYFINRNYSITLVLTESSYRIFCAAFNIDAEVDTSQTFEGKVVNTVKPYLRQRLTKKRQARLRQALAELIHKAWYDVSFDYGSISFKYNAKCYTISLTDQGHLSAFDVK
jgi:hypothetical protein